MKLIYNVFKKYGTQTDRTGYTLFNVEVEFYPLSNKYQINFQENKMIPVKNKTGKVIGYCQKPTNKESSEVK